jgi:ribosomal protein L22
LDEYYGEHNEDYDMIYNQIEEASKGKDDIVIPENIDEDIKDKLKSALKSAETKANSYKDGINIADAAVYVSPTFYRNLMRMLGTSWSDKAEFGYNLMTEEGKLYLTP